MLMRKMDTPALMNTAARHILQTHQKQECKRQTGTDGLAENRALNQLSEPAVEVHLRIKEQAVYHIMQRGRAKPHRQIELEAIGKRAAHQKEADVICKQKRNTAEHSGEQRVHACRYLR